MNIEGLKWTLADDLNALREGKTVLGVDEIADAVEQLGPEYRVHARAIRSSKGDTQQLATQYAMVLEKLERAPQM